MKKLWDCCNELEGLSDLKKDLIWRTCASMPAFSQELLRKPFPTVLDQWSRDPVKNMVKISRYEKFNFKIK